jgi:hypothetical protein
LAVGNAPITPARHAAVTRSTPETPSIGAVMMGKRSRVAKRDGKAVRLGSMGTFQVEITCLLQQPEEPILKGALLRGIVASDEFPARRPDPRTRGLARPSSVEGVRIAHLLR